MSQIFEMTLTDGGTLAYRQWGEATGKPVVLVHSLAMTGGFWQPVAEMLAGKGFWVIAPDCRGHGGSSLKEGLTVERAADDIAELLDHLAISTTGIAGASMGGSVALAFAIRHPGRTRAIGLVDTTAWYGEEAPKTWKERAEKARAEGLETLVGFQTTRWFSDGFRKNSPQVVAAAVETFLANDIDGYASACRMLGSCDMRPGLLGIAVPTVVLVGEEDYATPVAMAEAMAIAIPDAELHVLPGLRHLTPLEAPETIAGRLGIVFGGGSR